MFSMQVFAGRNTQHRYDTHKIGLLSTLTQISLQDKQNLPLAIQAG